MEERNTSEETEAREESLRRGARAEDDGPEVEGHRARPGLNDEDDEGPEVEGHRKMG